MIVVGEGMKKVCLLFGGRSEEHQVSITSTRSIVQAIDQEKFLVHLGGLDRNNRLQFFTVNQFLERFAPFSSFDLVEKASSFEELKEFDIIFPLIHGKNGEDGALQGLLELLDIAYVGADHYGSAICMDKGVTKHLLREKGLPIADFLLLTRHSHFDLGMIEKRFSFPLFVKPTRSGSSFGISRVDKKEELTLAMEEAFKYSNQIIIEKAIIGMEIACSVLGLEDLIVSRPARVIPHQEFYTYDAKYIDPNGASFEVPALLDEELTNEIRYLAKEAFLATNTEMMARVDFLVDTEGCPFISELNTLPGFTEISLYPKMLIELGYTYQQIITILLELAWKRKEGQKLAIAQYQPARI